jgi:Domain of unknown function (DUF1905)
VRRPEHRAAVLSVAYLLPVKKAVRAAEHLETGDEVKAQLKIADL